MIKHYTQRIPRCVKKEYRDLLGIKLGWFATYADLLDKLWKKGYWIELKPFHTFAFADKTAVIFKLWKRDVDGLWKCIYDDEMEEAQWYGSSFHYAMGKTAIKEITRRIGK